MLYFYVLSTVLRKSTYILYLIGRFKRGSQRADVDLLQTNMNTNSKIFTACAAKNLSVKKASHTYGISNYGLLRSEAEGTLQKACEIGKEVKWHRCHKQQ